MRRGLLVVTLLCLCWTSARGEPVTQQPVLRLLPLAEGVRDVLNRGGDAAALRKKDEYRRARAAGVDLANITDDPVVAHGMRGGRLFYVFYKKLERAYGARQWIVQRIKRTERNWTAGASEPETKVTYQVEAFKLFAGEQKRGDQHHGGYTLGERERREIVKEYEIGFADVPGTAEGDAWPWKASTLFEYLARYGPSRTLYDKVRFRNSLRWSLTVRLGRDDRYEVLSPELGIEVPKQATDPARTLPQPIAAGKDLVLVRGSGLAGAQDFDTCVRLAGPIVQSRPAGKSNTNVMLAAGLMINRRSDGSVNTVQTRSGFAGATRAGIRVGSPRWAVLKAYGQPKDAKVSAAWWHYGDIGFWFDGLDRVGRIYVRKTNK
ncbi:MAG: hypothetical protein QNJ90_01790 [Planctomycetota bacterium]|nr:hypothetical protein [Planctomycetota bacterium]